MKWPLTIPTVVFSLLASLQICQAGQPVNPDMTRNALLAGPMLQIPGPNPILTPGEEGDWDDEIVEAGDAFNDHGTYYLYYHGNGGEGYKIGVATASHPLGPFRKAGKAPVLNTGPKGAWDDRHVACAMILKEGTDRYTMWYSGYGTQEKDERWGIGIATSNGPLGPWEKASANPVIPHFGYVGGVVKVKRKYYLYTAHPIGSTGADYSPISLATSDSPEGPWAIEEKPVLHQGEWGEWDDGGFSEAEVVFHSGVFHLFYGGAKLHPERIRTRESIGYAYSFNGRDFVKYGLNPVAAREANPNAAAFAEVHTIIEPPFIYLYHTLRYCQPWRERFREQFPVVEDLGVQVLVTQSPFKLDMPVLQLDTLEKGATALADCPPISLDKVDHVSLTVEAISHGAATDLKVLVYSSTDGINYDNRPLAACTFNLLLPVGAEDNAPHREIRQTFNLPETSARWIKLRLQQVDKGSKISNLKVTATLSG
jgi:hypothetical protein